MWGLVAQYCDLAPSKPGPSYTKSPNLTRRPLRHSSPKPLSWRMSSEKRVLYEAPPEELRSEHKENKMSFSGSGHWFVWDPCGIVCAVMTYILILYGELVVLMVLAPPFPSLSTAVCVIIFTTLAILAVVSHVKAMITDPVSLKLSGGVLDVLNRF